MIFFIVSKQFNQTQPNRFLKSCIASSVSLSISAVLLCKIGKHWLFSSGCASRIDESGSIHIASKENDTSSSHALITICFPCATNVISCPSAALSSLSFAKTFSKRSLCLIIWSKLKSHINSIGQAAIKAANVAYFYIVGRETSNCILFCFAAWYINTYSDQVIDISIKTKHDVIKIDRCPGRN